MRILRSLMDVVVHKILGLDDSPHRIAWGVLLGFVVAMTPTIGLQIVIYVALATLLRVNKVAGVPILFISNPVTAVPLYGFCWWVGNLTLHGGHGGTSWAQVREQLMEGVPATEGVYAQLLSAQFWGRVGEAMAQLGGELWLGSFILGVATGVPGYLLTLWGIRTYRRRGTVVAVADDALADVNVRTTGTEKRDATDYHSQG